jgi:PAS domain-containing protein
MRIMSFYGARTEPVFPAEYWSYPVLQNGEITGAVVSFLDITERKQALEDSNRRYQQLFDNNPEAMFVYDLESLAFLAVNDAFINCYGWSRDEFLRMTLGHPPNLRSPRIDELPLRSSCGL